MQIQAKTKYSNEPAYIKFGRYQDGSLAMELYTLETHEPLLRATVSLEEYGLKPDVDKHEVFIKNYSENDGVFQMLIDEGVITDTGRVHHLPLVSVPVGILTEKAISALAEQEL
jgi:hypothetical protein